MQVSRYTDIRAQFNSISIIACLIIATLFSAEVKAEINVTPPKRISGETHRVIEGTTELYRFQVSPDDKFVIYPATKGINETLHLYSVPVSRGPAVQLTPEAVVDLIDYKISPDSKSVIYRGRNGLNSVPIAGGPSIRLDSIRPFVSSIDVVEFTPDSQHIVYYEVGELWSIGISGMNATQLNENQPT